MISVPAAHRYPTETAAALMISARPTSALREPVAIVSALAPANPAWRPTLRKPAMASAITSQRVQIPTTSAQMDPAMVLAPALFLASVAIVCVVLTRATNRAVKTATALAVTVSARGRRQGVDCAQTIAQRGSGCG